MDLGFHHSMANALRVHMSAEDCARQSKHSAQEALSRCLEGLDSRLDKQKFLEHNNSAFMIPKRFEFMGQKGDDATQISAASGVVEDLEARYVRSVIETNF
jgi:SLIT-ROBO Rho GTPase activating protein